jgi:NAD(P)H-hydrate epimerase
MNEIHQYTRLEEAAGMLIKRPADAHKGTMGHAALIAGSYGMLGAAILSAKACLRSGVGKLTCFVSPDSYPIVQGAIPEAVFQIFTEKAPLHAFDFSQFDSIGIGPGIGRKEEHAILLDVLFSLGIPMVVDADALNTIARHPHLIKSLPENTILTPHRAEFERMFGKMVDARKIAVELGVVIVEKGPHSRIACPDGSAYLNDSGNAGMATAGSGDVLTGVITGLLARGYDAVSAARLGVFLHGSAGDLAAAENGEESMIAGDIIRFLASAFLRIESQSK